MVTQPQLTVFVTSPKAVRPRVVLGTEFRFVRCKPEDLFGVTDHWATKTETIRVSDIERTVIDGLKQPEHCGGITDVAKGFWMRRDVIDAGKLVDYDSSSIPSRFQLHRSCSGCGPVSRRATRSSTRSCPRRALSRHGGGCG